MLTKEDIFITRNGKTIAKVINPQVSAVDSLRGMLKNVPSDIDLDSLRRSGCQNMKIMCDTNIILDVLLERQPFVEDSYKVLSLCEEHRLEGFVSASSVTEHLLSGQKIHPQHRTRLPGGWEDAGDCKSVQRYQQRCSDRIPEKSEGF